MSFVAPYDGYTEGDLFYGLAKTRDELMQKLGVSSDHAKGARINSYDIGDITSPSQVKPLENDSFRNFLGAHKKYAAVVDMKTVRYEWRHWRQKSKGGIEWATKFAQPRKHVHFCLDKMTDPDVMEAIAMKNWADDSLKGTPWEVKVRSITNAELRWIYRHRHEDEVKKHVQFWEKSVQCEPPWERPHLSGIWASYLPLHSYV
jgi:hypothetical protein